jgi:hypothetical protein
VSGLIERRFLEVNPPARHRSAEARKSSLTQGENWQNGCDGLMMRNASDNGIGRA